MNFIYQDLRLIGQDESQTYSLYLAGALKMRKSFPRYEKYSIMS